MRLPGPAAVSTTSVPEPCPPERPACCVPARAVEARLRDSQRHSAQRRRAASGSMADMTVLDGGVFLMGSEEPGTFEADGEGPVRRVRVSPFAISRHAVTNGEFGTFVRKTGYRTEAEKIGWSFVFDLDTPGNSTPAPQAAWWRIVPNASWASPKGSDSSVRGHADYPVVHVSWNDAQAYCEWAGYRLPTEAEWEFACRGRLESKRYPWGDELVPDGQHRCNIWQGDFPVRDTGEDGYRGLAPVSAFAPNGFGLYNMTGNVWEWTEDRFSAEWHRTATRIDPVGPPEGDSRVIRGGSYLCHSSYCNRYRNSARSANTPDSSTGNLGFRVVRDV